MSINFEFSPDCWYWETPQLIEENKAYVLKQIKTMTWADVQQIRSAEWRNEAFVVQVPNSFDAWMFHITAVDFERNWVYLYWGGTMQYFSTDGFYYPEEDEEIRTAPWLAAEWFIENGMFKQPVRVEGVKGLG
jgi:hypothetical protein